MPPRRHAAAPAFLQYWADQGIDIAPFVDAADGEVIYPPIGDKAQAGIEAAHARGLPRPHTGGAGARRRPRSRQRRDRWLMSPALDNLRRKL